MIAQRSVMRAVTTRDALDHAAGRARQLERELREALRDPDLQDDRPRLRLAYSAALAECLVWTTRIMDAASARGEACPFCAAGEP